MFCIGMFFKGRKSRTQMLHYRGEFSSSLKNAFEIFEKKKPREKFFKSIEFNLNSELHSQPFFILFNFHIIAMHSNLKE